MVRLAAALILNLIMVVGCATRPDAAWQLWHEADTARWVAIHRQIEAEDYGAATGALEALWLEATDESGPRTFYYGNLIRPVARLSDRHGPARERFMAIGRAGLERVLAGRATRFEERVWLDLNHAVGDDAALSKYAEWVLGDRDRRRLLAYYEHRAFERLIAVGRWDLAGRLYDDAVDRTLPVQTPGVLAPLETAAALTVGMAALPLWVWWGGFVTPMPPGYPLTALLPPKPPTPEEQVTSEQRTLRNAAVTWAALRAAGRNEDAAELRRRADRIWGAATVAPSFEGAKREAGLE